MMSQCQMPYWGTNHQVLSCSQLPLLQISMVLYFKQSEKEEVALLLSLVLFRADTGNLIS